MPQKLNPDLCEIVEAMANFSVEHLKFSVTRVRSCDTKFE